MFLIFVFVYCFVFLQLYIYYLYGSTCVSVSIGLLLLTGALVNGPYALITTAVSAKLGLDPTLATNTRALSTVTAIIDGTGSMGKRFILEFVFNYELAASLLGIFVLYRLWFCNFVFARSCFLFHDERTVFKVRKKNVKLLFLWSKFHFFFLSWLVKCKAFLNRIFRQFFNNYHFSIKSWKECNNVLFISPTSCLV